MGFKNDFGFVKLPSIKNSHIYSDSQLKKLNFGQNEIKALKKLYSRNTNKYFENKIFNKAKKIFYKKINNQEKLLNHEIYTRVTSNYSKSLFNSKKKGEIINSLKRMKSININNFQYDNIFNSTPSISTSITNKTSSISRSSTNKGIGY